MTAHQAFHHVAATTRILGVSPSGYYAWRKRPLSARARTDVELTAHIHAVHRESRGTDGAPRIHADLAAHGIHVGRKRVARLMRAAGLQGVSRRKACRTTVRGETARPALDLVDRQFEVAGPDRLWVADITYVPTGAGFLYLAVVLDAWSRRVIGWTMASHLRTELVLAALGMALAPRRPANVIRHSDHGCQYTPSPSAIGVGTPASVPRWGASAMRTTTRCARVSSRPSSASCWIGTASRRTPTRASPSPHEVERCLQARCDRRQRLAQNTFMMAPSTW